MAKEASANKVISLNFLSTLLVDLIGVVTAPILSRLLGKNGYGVVSIYSTWVSVFAVIVGLHAESSIGNAEQDFPENEQNRYQSSILFLCTIWMLPILALTLIFINPLAELSQLAAWMVPLIIVHAYGNFAVNLLQAKLKYEFKPTKNLFATIGTSFFVALLSILLAFLLPPDIRYAGKIIGTAVPYTLFGLVLAFYLFFKGREFVNWQYWKYCLKISVPLVPSGICALILGQSDRLMLQRMMSMEAVGLYTLTFNYSNIIGGIWSGLNNAWLPFFYRMEQNQDDEGLKRRLTNYTRLFTTLVIGFVLLSPEVFALYGGDEFAEGKSLITVFAAAFYAQFINSIAVNYEYYNKKTRQIAAISVIISLVNVGLNYFLIPICGVFGAAFATMIMHMVSAAWHWHIDRHRTDGCEPLSIPFTSLFPYILTVLLAIMLFWAVPRSLWWMRWSLGACVGLMQLNHMWKNRTIF